MRLWTLEAIPRFTGGYYAHLQRSFCVSLKVICASLEAILRISGGILRVSGDNSARLQMPFCASLRADHRSAPAAVLLIRLALLASSSRRCASQVPRTAPTRGDGGRTQQRPRSSGPRSGAPPRPIGRYQSGRRSKTAPLWSLGSDALPGTGPYAQGCLTEPALNF